MSPYSVLLLTNQGLSSGQAQLLLDISQNAEAGAVGNKPSAEAAVGPRRTGAEVANLRQRTSAEVEVVAKRKALTSRRRSRAASAPSFFSQGPEEEVFDLELEEGLSPVFLTPTSSPVLRAGRTPGARHKRPATPKPHKPRKNFELLAQQNFKCEEFMDYAVDTYLWKRQLENKYRAERSSDLDTDATEEIRHTLVQWLIRVCRQFGFSLETWCLTVNYLDRFLAKQSLDKECIQLTGLTALLIAAKMEEQSVPEIMEFVKLCASAYTRSHFKHMEVIMLSKLNYSLLAPTPSFILGHLVQIRGDREWPVDLSRHMVEMCLCTEEAYLYSPTAIAHSVYTVIKNADPLSISEVTMCCPVCEPARGDLYSREFFICCFEDILKNMKREFFGEKLGPHASGV